MLKIFKQYYPIRNIIFYIIEFLLICSSVLFSSWILLGHDALISDQWIIFKIFLITIPCQICMYYNDLYNLQITNSYSELSIRLFQALGIASIFLAGVYFLFPGVIIGEGIYVVTIGFSILLIAVWRLVYTIILNREMFNERIILLGSSKLAQDIIKEINENIDCGYTIAMVITEDDVSNETFEKYSGKIICGKDYSNLCEIANELKIRKIIVAIRQRRGAFPSKELLKCRVDGIDILRGNTFYEMLTGKLIVEAINPAWLIFSKGFKKSARTQFLKRTVDLVFSFSLLTILLPLIIITAILIKLDSRGPVIFSQERVGEKRKKYMVHKFRSMIEDAEKYSGPVWASDNDDRITRVGRVIRKLRIDEIPQLWNVLKGEMSFVGPRPEREFFVEQLEEQIPYYGERFTVKPGITGWAQVSYGYGASVDDAVEKLNYELFYTKNFSIFMDLMIVMRTIKTVIFGKGR